MKNASRKMRTIFPLRMNRTPAEKTNRANPLKNSPQIPKNTGKKRKTPSKAGTGKKGGGSPMNAKGAVQPVRVQVPIAARTSRADKPRCNSAVAAPPAL